jgi:glycerophosphoryl diester phosphodiesterase
VTYNLTEISQFAHGVGPRSDWLFNYKNEPYNLTSPSLFVEECHELGLAVHPYSLQDDMLKYTSSPLDEHKLFVDKGVDGVFCEFPHLSRAAFEKIKAWNAFPQDRRFQLE